VSHGKRLMSPPISARMPWALKSLTPGMVVRRWTVRAKGLDMSVDLPIDSADGGVERIDVLEVQPHQKAVVMPRRRQSADRALGDALRCTLRRNEPHVIDHDRASGATAGTDQN